VLAGIAILPCLILWVFGQEIIVVILGARWETAGRIVEIMAPYLFTEWIGAPFQSAAIVMRKQKFWFWAQTIAAATRWIILPLAIFTPATLELIVSAYVWATVISHAAVMLALSRYVMRTGTPSSG